MEKQSQSHLSVAIWPGRCCSCQLQTHQRPSKSPTIHQCHLLCPVFTGMGEPATADTEPDQTDSSRSATHSAPTRKGFWNAVIRCRSFKMAFLIVVQFPHFSDQFTAWRGRPRQIDFFNPPVEKRSPVVEKIITVRKKDESPIHGILKLARPNI